MSLPDVWFALFVLIVAGYLILDGFDMGVGILHVPIARDRPRAADDAQQHRPGLGRQRGLAGASAGGVLFARLPARLRLAVLGLLPRVHARAAGDDPAHGRDRVPEQGGVAALAIGLGHRVLARVGRASRCCWAWRSATSVSGVPLDADGNITIRLVELLTPFALLVGVTTVAMFAMHGALYLVMKTEGDLQARIAARCCRGCSSRSSSSTRWSWSRWCCSASRSPHRYLDDIWPVIFPLGALRRARRRVDRSSGRARALAAFVCLRAR